MNHRIILVGLCVLTFAITASSQYRSTSNEVSGTAVLTGSLHNDLLVHQELTVSADSARQSIKRVRKNTYSPLAAGLLSAAVPGAGQFYTKSYWQGAAFFGVEVLAWVAYAAYEREGNQRTDAFQQYANEHWSVVRYANWINSPNGFPQYYRAGIIIGTPRDGVADPWNYVDWNLLNQTEVEIGNRLVGSGFTHQLAPYADQQYYEMIGKYSQFGGGWDDAESFKAGGYTRTDVVANNGIGNVSPRFIEYSRMRGDANSSYNIATGVSIVIIANHVLSALEAAFNAAHINHKIQLEGHILPRQIEGTMVEFVPTLQVHYQL
jgi:hypothetical protein